MVIRILVVLLIFVVILVMTFPFLMTARFAAIMIVASPDKTSR